MLLAEETTSPTIKPASDEPLQARADYSRALRAIGQDLSDIFPRVLEVENDGTNYIARGQSHPDPFLAYKESARINFWRRLRGRSNPAAPIESPAPVFERTYTPADIERLDRLYSANRTGRLERPDSYSLAERLRTMGNIVNARGGRLKRLSKNADHLSVEYWDQNNEIKTAKLTTVIMYREPHAEILPGTSPRRLWEGYDF